LGLDRFHRLSDENALIEESERDSSQQQSMGKIKLPVKGAKSVVPQKNRGKKSKEAADNSQAGLIQLNCCPVNP